MNYFEFYSGDYMRDTGELSLAEHGAYLKLLMSYYSTERALPADMPSLYRICSAMDAAERAAVKKVATRYFPLGEDGLRHKNRCDEDIATAQRRIESAKANGKKGGRPPKKNPTGTEVKPTGFHSANPIETQSGEALHAPHAISQNLSSGQALGSTEAATAAGRACRLMRDAGCMRTNPSHAALGEALEAGVTPEALGDTAREGVEAGKGDPFAWAITTALKRLQDSRRPVKPGPARVVPASRHVAGTAGFLGASDERSNRDSDLVLDVDRRGLGDPVPALPGRVSGG